MDKFVMILAFVLLVFHSTSVNGEECPTWYRRYSKKHTYCIPDNDKCDLMDTELPDDDKEIILMEHNRYRSMVAMAQADGMPEASNMLQMEWDEELSIIAQKHANRCRFKHDCADCRKVKNFVVGQNICMELVSTILKPPEADWFGAMSSWWDESQHFDSDCIDPYVKPSKRGNYAQFSQLIWAKTWKVGCGYAMFKDGDNYCKFYVCNYGPEGNLIQGSVYESGPACSKCPEGTCCGENCDKTEYEGLCKLHTGKRPVYKPQGEYLFYCNFEGQSDCDVRIEGVNNWKMYDTLSGKFLGIILNGGDTSTITFKKHIKSNSDEYCLMVNYRKGANTDGDDDAIDATENFFIIEEKQSVEQPMTTYLGAKKHRMNSFYVTCDWNKETEISIIVSVPEGEQPQYFEVSEIYGKDGPCPEN